MKLDIHGRTVLMLTVFKEDERLPQDVIDNYNLAIQSVGKQIPMKASGRMSEQGYVRECSGCGRHTDYGYAYCRLCGQRQDWSETE